MAIKIVTVTEYRASVTVPQEFFWARYDAQGVGQCYLINSDELQTLLSPTYALIHDRKRCIAWELQCSALNDNAPHEYEDTASFYALEDATLWAQLVQSAYDTALAELRTKYCESEGSQTMLTYWGRGELVAR